MTGDPSRLGRQITQIVGELNGARVTFALIGGLALAVHGVVRATSEISLMIRTEDEAEFSRLVAKLGYSCFHQSADDGSFLRGDERLDVLFASRPGARALLDAAHACGTPFGDLRVVSAEGLITLKLKPDLSRRQIESEACAARDPFEALDDLMVVVEGLCPVWPEKDLPRVTVGFLL